jgi:hypothetical protein
VNTAGYEHGRAAAIATIIDAIIDAIIATIVTIIVTIVTITLHMQKRFHGLQLLAAIAATIGSS